MKPLEMISITRPTFEVLEDFLVEQREKPYSYEITHGTLHATKSSLENDERFKTYNVDHHRILLGKGSLAFDKAVFSLREWKQFAIDWVQLFPNNPAASLEVGKEVAVAARSFGVWTVSACRIVYIQNEFRDNWKRFGFAYGTLPGHVIQGEERFLVEWNTNTDEVFFDILSYSLPQTVYSKVGYPVARWFQDSFANGSLLAMAHSVNLETDI